jgi:hypothetical protein
LEAIKDEKALRAAVAIIIYLQRTRQESNLQPSVPKTDALSSCATGANRLFSIRFQSRRFKRRRGVEINRGHPRPAAELAGGCSQ